MLLGFRDAAERCEIWRNLPRNVLFNCLRPTLSLPFLKSDFQDSHQNDFKGREDEFNDTFHTPYGLDFGNDLASGPVFFSGVEMPTLIRTNFSP